MENVRMWPDGDPHAFKYLPMSENTESSFLARGSAADIWKVIGDTNNDGRPNFVYVSKLVRVAPEDFVGYVRSRPSNTDKSSCGKMSWDYFVQQCKEKVSVWIQLTHNNLVRVYGLQQTLNLCVEYCPKGSLRDYIQAESSGCLDKEYMICDILKGMESIHGRDPPLVHGNLNAGKIFVGGDGRTKIGEFGLTALCYHVAPLVAPLLSTVVFTGFNRWMSPELFEFEADKTPVPTVASDIWALACTIFEIISEKLPYPEYKHDIRVQRAILKGELPGNFARALESSHCPGFWALLESCWSKDPVQRPSIKKILENHTENRSSQSSLPPSQLAIAPEFDLDLTTSGQCDTPTIPRPTSSPTTLPKDPHAVSMKRPNKQVHSSQVARIDPPISWTPLDLVMDDIDPALPSSGDPIMSPATLRGHLEEMSTPSTRTLISSLSDSVGQMGIEDPTNSRVNNTYGLFGSTSVSYYGRSTGVRTSPYLLSPFHGSFLPNPSLQPIQDNHGYMARQNSTQSNRSFLAAPSSYRPSISGSGLPPPPRQSMHTQTTRPLARSPKVATTPLLRGLRSRSSWEQYHESLLGFRLDDEGTDDEYEDKDEATSVSNWSWAAGQRVHKHTPSFLDLRGRRQSQL